MIQNTGKKKVLTEQEINKEVLPSTGEVLGVVVRLLGNDRVLVKCTDENTRLCRIRGKMKRRVWIKIDDIVLVTPWDFKSDKRGDIVWRYTRGGVERLRRKGYLQVSDLL